MQRNLSKLNIEDQQTISLELWTGGGNLVALDDFKSYFTDETELVDTLRNIILLVPRKIKNIEEGIKKITNFGAAPGSRL